LFKYKSIIFLFTATTINEKKQGKKLRLQVMATGIYKIKEHTFHHQKLRQKHLPCSPRRKPPIITLSSFCAAKTIKLKTGITTVKITVLFFIIY
jgi:hypothetical protein